MTNKTDDLIPLRERLHERFELLLAHAINTKAPYARQLIHMLVETACEVAASRVGAPPPAQEMIADFLQRAAVCEDYAEQHREEGNEHARQFHLGAAMAFRDMAEKYRARATGAPPPASPSGWQPIETAPKDGTDVLLARKDGVDIGSWQEAQPDGFESGVIVDPGLPEGWYGYLGFSPFDDPPTHWMPLPVPPAERSVLPVEPQKEEGDTRQSPPSGLEQGDLRDGD